MNSELHGDLPLILVYLLVCWMKKIGLLFSLYFCEGSYDNADQACARLDKTSSGFGNSDHSLARLDKTIERVWKFAGVMSRGFCPRRRPRIRNRALSRSSLSQHRSVSSLAFTLVRSALC